MHPLHPGAQVLHKHVTHLWDMSSGDGVVVLDLGPHRSRTRVGSGQPLLSTCCPDAHRGLTLLPSQQALMENWGFLPLYCCCVSLVVSDSVRPHKRQPTRLPHPWDSPGKNTAVGCHFLLQCMKVKSESEVAQSCLTLVTPWAAAYQAPPSMGLSRQKYWSGVPLPSLSSLFTEEETEVREADDLAQVFLTLGKHKLCP